MALNFLNIRSGATIANLASSPSNPVNGDIYYDTVLSKFRLYKNSAWSDLFGGGGSVTRSSVDAMYKEFAITATGGDNVLVERTLPTFNKDVWVTASGTMTVAKEEPAAVGSQNSLLIVSGYNGGVTTGCEKFNGVNSITTGSLGTGTAVCAVTGTVNAALKACGFQASPNWSSVSERFNGSTWSGITNAPTARYGPGGAGVPGAMVVAGGYNSGNRAETEIWNGSTWSSGNNISSARQGPCGAGTQNAMLLFGGHDGSVVGTTDRYNGSFWVATTSMNTGRYYHGGGGTYGAALGHNGPDASAEKWNGQYWAYTQPALVYTGDPACNNASGAQNAHTTVGGGGPNANIYKFFGELPYEIVATFKGADNDMQEFRDSFTINENGYLAVDVRISPNNSFSDQEIAGLAKLEHQDFGDGKWTASGNLNTGRNSSVVTGFQNSGLIFGGDTTFGGASTANSETFNGTSWTSVVGGNLGTARRSHSGFGIQNASTAAGGVNASSITIDTTEKFNGSTWTISGNLTASRNSSFAAGVMNAGVLYAGSPSDTANATNTTMKFNGSTWSNVSGSGGTSLVSGAASGAQNAALAFGGQVPAGTRQTLAQCFNGTLWISKSYMNILRSGNSGGGTMNNTFVSCGDNTGGTLSVTEKWNGMAWFIGANVNTARVYLSGSGTSSAAITCGGYTGSVSAVTEKYNTELTIPYTGAILGKIRY